MPSLDDRVKSALDRVLVSLSGHIESEMVASTSDIRRAVSEDHARTAAEAESAASQIATLQRAIEELREALGASLASAERLRGEVETARRERDDAVHAAEDQKRNAEQAQAEAEGALREFEGARDALAQAERLSDGLRALDDAASLGDVFDELGRVACQESDRAAVFLVRGDQLRGWRAIGFDATEPILGSDLDVEQAGVVGEAVRSGSGRQHPNGEGSSLPAFAEGASSRHAIALPVEVGGSVIAVLYADAVRSDNPDEPRWPAVLDVMAKHAGRVLEAMTVRQAAALWTPRATGRRPPPPNRPVPGTGAR